MGYSKKAIAVLAVILLIQGCATTYNLATQKEETTFISSDKEERIGENLSKQVEDKFELEPDILTQERVKEVGEKIADVCDRKTISYHFAVLADEDNLNAFSLPGGYVYIFKGLLSKIESDDELAGVLAHEVAHITARHSVKRMQASFGDTLFRLALSQIETDSVTRARVNKALNELMLGYSREDEVLADRLSIKYMKLAGYKPEGMVTFLNRLMDIQQKGPIERYHHYRTHPYISERLSIVKEEVYGRMDFRDYINIGDERLPKKSE